MFKKTINLFLALIFIYQLLSLTGCSADKGINEDRTSPSDRIDDVERRNEDLFKDMD